MRRKVICVVMGALVILLGLVWLVCTILSEEVFTKQVPKNTDYRQAFIDSNAKGVSGKELNKRLSSGYYVKKDK